MRDKEGQPTDYRRTRKRDERRLLLYGILLLVFFGGGLIGVIYGPMRMLGAIPCLVAGAAAMAGLHLLLGLMEKWVNR